MFKLRVVVQDALKISTLNAEGTVRAFLNYCVENGKKIEEVIGSPVSIEKLQECIVKDFKLENAAEINFASVVGTKYRARIFEPMSFEQLVATVNEAVVKAADTKLVTMDEEVVVTAGAGAVSAIEVSAAPAIAALPTVASADEMAADGVDAGASDSEKPSPATVETAPGSDLFVEVSDADAKKPDTAAIPVTPMARAATPFADHEEEVKPEVKAKVFTNPLHDALMDASDFYFSLQMAKAGLQDSFDETRKKSFYNMLQMIIAKLHLERDAATRMIFINELVECLDLHKDQLAEITKPLQQIIQMIYEHRRSVMEYSTKDRAFWQVWFQADRVQAKIDGANSLIDNSNEQLTALVTGKIASLKSKEDVVADQAAKALAHRGWWTRDYVAKEAATMRIVDEVKALDFTRPEGVVPALDEQLDVLLQVVAPEYHPVVVAAAGAGASV